MLILLLKREVIPCHGILREMLHSPIVVEFPDSGPAVSGLPHSGFMNSGLPPDMGFENSSLP